jgi:short-subunit dehydrogenase
MNRSSRKTAVITGATQGIGKAIAEKLLAEGFSIAICARNQQDLTAVKEAWEAQYPEAHILAVSADFSKEIEVTFFAQKILLEFSRIDVLVNNAGIFQPGNLADEPKGQLEEMMQVNLFAAYHLTRALLPAMKEKGSGHIFNLCSVASLRAYPNGGAYSITKYALLGFSDNLREELKPYGLRVTAICPGATWSRSWSGSGVARNRIMEASDVAGIIWATCTLSATANVETIIMRPQQGDL